MRIYVLVDCRGTHCAKRAALAHTHSEGITAIEGASAKATDIRPANELVEFLSELLNRYDQELTNCGDSGPSQVVFIPFGFDVETRWLAHPMEAGSIVGLKFERRYQQRRASVQDFAVDEALKVAIEDYDSQVEQGNDHQFGCVFLLPFELPRGDLGDFGASLQGRTFTRKPEWDLVIAIQPQVLETVRFKRRFLRRMSIKSVNSTFRQWAHAIRPAQSAAKEAVIPRHFVRWYLFHRGLLQVFTEGDVTRSEKVDAHPKKSEYKNFLDTVYLDLRSNAEYKKALSDKRHVHFAELHLTKALKDLIKRDDGTTPVQGSASIETTGATSATSSKSLMTLEAALLSAEWTKTSLRGNDALVKHVLLCYLALNGFRELSSDQEAILLSKIFGTPLFTDIRSVLDKVCEDMKSDVDFQKASSEMRVEQFVENHLEKALQGFIWNEGVATQSPALYGGDSRSGRQPIILPLLLPELKRSDVHVVPTDPTKPPTEPFIAMEGSITTDAKVAALSKYFVRNYLIKHGLVRGNEQDIVISKKIDAYPRSPILTLFLDTAYDDMRGVVEYRKALTANLHVEFAEKYLNMALLDYMRSDFFTKDGNGYDGGSSQPKPAVPADPTKPFTSMPGPIHNDLDDGARSTPLQLAIRRSAPGTPLHLGVGEWLGGIRLDGDHTFLGESASRSATIFTQGGVALEVTRGHIQLRNLMIDAGSNGIAIRVHPGAKLTTEHVLIRGLVEGIPGEDQPWRYPDMAVLQDAPARRTSRHAIPVSLPVPCTVNSHIEGATAVLRDGVIDLVLDGERDGTVFHGYIVLRSQWFHRRMQVSGRFSSAASAAYAASASSAAHPTLDQARVDLVRMLASAALAASTTQPTLDQARAALIRVLLAGLQIAIVRSMGGSPSFSPVKNEATPKLKQVSRDLLPSPSPLPAPLPDSKRSSPLVPTELTKPFTSIPGPILPRVTSTTADLLMEECGHLWKSQPFDSGIALVCQRCYVIRKRWDGVACSGKDFQEHGHVWSLRGDGYLRCQACSVSRSEFLLEDQLVSCSVKVVPSDHAFYSSISHLKRCQITVPVEERRHLWDHEQLVCVTCGLQRSTWDLAFCPSMFANERGHEWTVGSLGWFRCRKCNLLRTDWIRDRATVTCGSEPSLDPGPLISSLSAAVPDVEMPISYTPSIPISVPPDESAKPVAKPDSAPGTVLKTQGSDLWSGCLEMILSIVLYGVFAVIATAVFALFIKLITK